MHSNDLPALQPGENLPGQFPTVPVALPRTAWPAPSVGALHQDFRSRNLFVPDGVRPN